VAEIDHEANSATVTWDGDAPPPASLIGRHILFTNELRTSAFRVVDAAAKGDTSTLTLRASLLNGRGLVTKLDEEARTLKTGSRMLFQAKYRGMRLASEDFRGYLPIRSASGGVFTLGGDGVLGEVFTDTTGDDRAEFWVSVTGPGDRVVLQRGIEITRGD